MDFLWIDVAVPTHELCGQFCLPPQMTQAAGIYNCTTECAPYLIQSPTLSECPQSLLIGVQPVSTIQVASMLLEQNSSAFAGMSNLVVHHTKKITPRTAGHVIVNLTPLLQNHDTNVARFLKTETGSSVQAVSGIASIVLGKCIRCAWDQQWGEPV